MEHAPSIPACANCPLFARLGCEDACRMQIRELELTRAKNSLGTICRDDESAWSQNVWLGVQGGNRVVKDGEEERETW